MTEAEIIADFFGSPCDFTPLDSEMTENCDCEHFCGTPEQTDSACWQRYFDFKKKEK